MKFKLIVDTIKNCTRMPSLAFMLHKKWYYHFDFGRQIEVCTNNRNNIYSGFNNWDFFLSKHLPSVEGKRILDVGCNAGLYALRMADEKAKEVIGIDRSIIQAEYIKKWFATNGKDYPAVKYVKGDVTKIRFKEFGNFDLVCMFCIAYHLGKYADSVMRQLTEFTTVVALQGNLRRLTKSKYNNRPFHELAGVEGMKGFLIKHGFDKIEVVSHEGHKKPLVIGSAC
ncbi:MAG TPA: DUF1698 domain-containing protein [Desulfitobacteriaceae bacterium]|nr:DUF1698 domain-containing protein [Desulfitobacteriaceae bacterium]